MNNTINVLRTLSRPENDITDEFGAMRDWAPIGELDPRTGRPGWNTISKYRPVHYGVDFSYRPNPTVFAPGDGVIKYQPMSSMITFVPVFQGSPVIDVAMYLMHTVRGSDAEWDRVAKGDPIGRISDESDYPPHLHLEMAVTLQLYADLRVFGVLKSAMPWDEEAFHMKANLAGIDRTAAWERVAAQILSDGIISIETDAIMRRNSPWYKRTPYSYLGQDAVVVIDPTKVMGDA